jgi:hypothetical protein
MERLVRLHTRLEPPAGDRKPRPAGYFAAGRRRSPQLAVTARRPVRTLARTGRKEPQDLAIPRESTGLRALLAFAGCETISN